MKKLTVNQVNEYKERISYKPQGAKSKPILQQTTQISPSTSVANLPEEFEETLDFGFEVEEMSLAEGGGRASTKIAILFCKGLKAALDKLPPGEKGIKVLLQKMMVPISAVNKNWNELFPNNPITIAVRKNKEQEKIGYRFWYKPNIK